MSPMYVRSATKCPVPLDARAHQWQPSPEVMGIEEDRAGNTHLFGEALHEEARSKRGHCWGSHPPSGSGSGKAAAVWPSTSRIRSQPMSGAGSFWR